MMTATMPVIDPGADLVDIGDALARLDQVNPLRIAGRVSEVTGLVVRATIPGVRVGELVSIDSASPSPAASPVRLRAEVVGFRGEEIVLMPLGDATGIGPDSLVTPSECRSLSPSVTACWSRLDGLGSPIAAASAARLRPGWPVDLARPRRWRADASPPAVAGSRAIDALLTVARGQPGFSRPPAPQVDCFLGQIARHTEADVIIICLTVELVARWSSLDQPLGPVGRRAGGVCATSDAPSWCG